MQVRSNACTGSIGCVSACDACLYTPALVKAVEDRARRPPTNLNRTSLSNHQLIERLDAVERKLKDEVLKHQNTSRSLDRLRAHEETWSNLLKLVGSEDVPGLHRIFKNAKWENWSAEILLEKLRDAVAGKYHPRSYSQLEYDLASVIYELGGDAALHALHRSPFAFPARTTLLQRRRDISIRITAGKAKISDILANIETMFEETHPGHKRVGITLSMDEISCDDRLCYLAETDDIAGLCEHAGGALPSVKMGQSPDVMRAVVAGIRDGRIHVGQEVFVAAFARNDEVGYGARPVLLMPTCKQGSFRDAALIIEMLRQAWRMSACGEVLHGPIWSIASDGDPKRRPALYLHCMVRELTSVDPLFTHLSGLRGLNLWVGSGGETQDLDYKHDFKRICKLLCTREGILVNNVIVNKGLLGLWLEKLTDVDWSENPIFSLLNPDSAVATRIQGLLNPKDAQDVPRAVKLLNLTAELRKLDTSDFNPSECQTHHALSLLGEMLAALLEPFVNPTLSLSQQITSLVKFAHIACALYMSHGSSFMPHHLYSDLQCMVRTAVFRVAHSKVLDPALKVFLCLLGDDVLEILFGRTRMIGGHKPNVDVAELGKRFESALRLDAIFHTYPHWERQPRRLKLQRSRDADHLSPRNWTGNLVAADCNLAACWKDGANQGEVACRTYGYDINFEAIFNAPSADLMRPHGGKYPGISADVDRSLGDGNAVVEGLEEIESGGFSIPQYNGRAEYEAESRCQANDDETPCSVWMELEGGKRAHKKTVLRLFMDPTFDIDYKKSTDRLLRVRYFSIGGDNWDRSMSHAINGQSVNLFRLGSLYATLVCTDKTKTSIAVLQCTAIKNGTQSLDCAPIDEISLPKTVYDVSGQILSLHPIAGEAARISWVWDSQYVSLNAATKSRSQQPTTTSGYRHLAFATHGSIVYPLQTHQISSITNSILPAGIDSKLNTTWLMSEEVLSEIESVLYKRVLADDHLQSKLPVFGTIRDGLFPYKALIGPETILEHSTTSIPVPMSANTPYPCFICQRSVSGSDRQNHMGAHILRMMRCVEESVRVSVPVAKNYPCGFCGKSSEAKGGCDISIKGGKAQSNCPQAYNFRISAAARRTNSKPCTNVPLKCRIASCNMVHWRYNLQRHLSDQHPSWEKNHSESDRKVIMADFSLSMEEETELGIPEERHGYSVTRIASYEGRRLPDPPGVHDKRGESPRHARYFISQRGTPPPHFNLDDTANLSSEYLPNTPE